MYRVLQAPQGEDDTVNYCRIEYPSCMPAASSPTRTSPEARLPTPQSTPQTIITPVPSNILGNSELLARESELSARNDASCKESFKLLLAC